MAQTAITKKLPISEALADIIGKSKASRGEVMKLVWVYIKKHKLQDKRDKRVINPDDRLSEVLGTKPINMFKMASKLSEHIG